VIFVTVGMHTLGFPRLVRAMDELAATLDEEVVIQMGATVYTPEHARSFAFATQAEMDKWCAAARVIVSQAGAGSILTAQKARVPLILVPRLKQYGEIIDDHQLELTRRLHQAGSAIVVEAVDELAQVLKHTQRFSPVESTRKRQLIRTLASRLTDLENGHREVAGKQ
jgi:beta-1,4-N-acetylglucosaminyltransferase